MPAAAAADLLERLDAFGVSVGAFELDPDEPDADLWQIEILHRGEPDRAGLADALNELAREVGVAGIDLQTMPVRDADWLEETARSFPPQRVGRFWVHGGHVEAPPPAGLLPVRIDAGLAFGSGDHATTRSCLLALDAIARRRRLARVLDLGCGSGILAIAAAKCWPARVVAADLDPVAVRTAAANAAINQVGGTVRVVRSDGFGHPLVRAAAPYSLIFANILARPLIELAPPLAGALRADGALVLAGLLDRQAGAVLRAYRARGLRLARLIGDGPWVTLVMVPRREHGRPSRAAGNRRDRLPGRSRHGA